MTPCNNSNPSASPTSLVTMTALYPVLSEEDGPTFGTVDLLVVLDRALEIIEEDDFLFERHARASILNTPGNNRATYPRGPNNNNGGLRKQ